MFCVLWRSARLDKDGAEVGSDMVSRALLSAPSNNCEFLTLNVVLIYVRRLCTSSILTLWSYANIIRYVPGRGVGSVLFTIAFFVGTKAVR